MVFRDLGLEDESSKNSLEKNPWIGSTRSTSFTIARRRNEMHERHHTIGAETTTSHTRDLDYVAPPIYYRRQYLWRYWAVIEANSP